MQTDGIYLETEKSHADLSPLISGNSGHDSQTPASAIKSTIVDAIKDAVRSNPKSQYESLNESLV